jgi:hypothetical protein
MSVNFDKIDQLLIRYSVFVRLQESWNYNGALHQLHVDIEDYDSVRREIFYNILIEFGVTVKLCRLMKMCLNETYSKVCTGKKSV